jgi:hypothetical protein
MLIKERFDALKAERAAADAAPPSLTDRGTGTLERRREACAVLDCPPDLSDVLARAEAELRRRVFDAYRLSVAIDKQRHSTAREGVSSAFTRPVTFRASSLMSP